jgi:hypothetical protein
MVSVGARHLARTHYWLTNNVGNRISSPRHILYKQARYIVGNCFWWIILKVTDVPVNFPLANVRLETSMRLLNGDGSW